MSMLKRLLPMLFIIFSLQAAAMSQKQPGEGIEVGNFAPKFQLYDLEGEVHSSDEFKGKLILLNFWATWCPACNYEKPFLEKVYKKYKNDGLIVLTVSVDQSKTALIRYLDKNPIDVPVYHDRGDLQNKFLVRAFPTTYVINKQGIIIAKKIGAFKWDDLDFSEFL